MLAVVGLQALVRWATDRWRCSRMLLNYVPVMAGACALIRVAGQLSQAVAATPMVVAAPGETQLASVVPAAANILAPAEARCQYCAAQSVAWSTVPLVEATCSGFTLGAKGTRTLFAVLVIVLSLAALAVLRPECVLHSVLNRDTNLLPDQSSDPERLTADDRVVRALS